MNQQALDTIQAAQAALQSFAATELGAPLQQLTDFDKLMLLSELVAKSPSLGSGLPVAGSYQAAVSVEEWSLSLESNRDAVQNTGDWDDLSYYSLNLMTLLFFWYFHMDCDPFEYDYDSLNTLSKAGFSS